MTTTQHKDNRGLSAERETGATALQSENKGEQLFRLLISWHYNTRGTAHVEIQECTFGNDAHYSFKGSHTIHWGQEVNSCIAKYLAKSPTIQRFLNETCTAEERAEIFRAPSLHTLEGLFTAHSWRVVSAGFDQAGKEIYVRIIDSPNN